MLQLPEELSIAWDRLCTSRDRRRESEMIFGARASSSSVEVVVAAAAAGSNPVQKGRNKMEPV